MFFNSLIYNIRDMILHKQQHWIEELYVTTLSYCATLFSGTLSVAVKFWKGIFYIHVNGNWLKLM